MATRVTASRMVGRDAERAELRSALAAAASGSPCLVLISGESGLGKSRLLGALADDARAAGARVVGGECVDLGGDELPYAPLVAMLRELHRARDPVLAGLSAPSRAELARLLPELGGPAAAAELEERTGGAQARVFEALLSLLDALGREQPVVLALEDMHWADPSTRAFLAFVARSLGTERLLVAATYRPDELHRRHPLRPLLAELERHRRSRRVDLEPLSRGELDDALADILGAAPDPALAGRLHARSEGNPLFAEELLAAELRGCDMSASLREAMLVRIERLSEDAQEVVRLLAAANRADHALLDEAGDLDPRALRAALREAVADHVLTTTPDGRYAFRHALLREVVHDDLLPGEQAALHLALARALERRDGGAQLRAAVAHHFAGAGDQPAALVAAVRAGEAAEAVHAYGEAATQYERALELWDRVPGAAERTGLDHPALLARAGHCQDQHGDDARAVALLERAFAELDAGADPVRAAGVLERLARAQWGLGRDVAAFLTTDRALALLPASAPSPERAGLLAWRAKAHMLAGRHADAVAAAEEAIAEARSAADAHAEGRALNACGVSLLALGDERGLEALRESLTIAGTSARPGDLRSAWVNLADALHVIGRSEEALAVADAGHRDLVARGDEVAWMELLRAEIAWELGRPGHAALPSVEDRLGSTRLYLLMLTAQRALAAGDHAAARAALDEVAGPAAASPEPQFFAPVAALRAELLRREGDLDAARTAIGEALDRLRGGEDTSRLAHAAVTATAVEADAAVRHRDVGEAGAEAAAVARAREHAALAACAADGWPPERTRAAEAGAELARAEGRPAAALWAAVAAAWKTAQRPHGEAAARLREAEAHAAAGAREAAEEAAAAARELARAIAATWVAREADGLAGRARLRLGDDGGAEAGADGEPFGLTPRERAVLGLVAQGRTNREIGATLFMAEKTASVHVSRILAKLDVRSRTEAAAVAHRHGLVS